MSESDHKLRGHPTCLPARDAFTDFASLFPLPCRRAKTMYGQNALVPNCNLTTRLADVTVKFPCCFNCRPLYPVISASPLAQWTLISVREGWKQLHLSIISCLLRYNCALPEAPIKTHPLILSSGCLNSSRNLLREDGCPVYFDFLAEPLNMYSHNGCLPDCLSKCFSWLKMCH